MVGVTGGDKFADMVEKSAKKLKNASQVTIGFLEGSTYPDGTSVPMVAAIHEFGAPDIYIPARPFFRPMIAKHSDEWPKVLAILLREKKYNTRLALEALGELVKGQLQQSIVDTTEPPLSPVTVMLRGMRRQTKFRDLRFGVLISIARRRVLEGKTNYGASTKPLEDTRVMLHAVDYIVE